MTSKATAECSILLSKDEKQQILGSHAPDGTQLDVKSLLSIVANILNHPVDGAITVEDKPGKLDFKAPSAMIEKLSCEMMCSCKGSDPKNLHKTTLSMLVKLSRYSWDAKVVLALSAYAVNYGDFCLLLHDICAQNQLGSHIAVLKGMSVLDEGTDLLEKQVAAINSLTKTILHVTQCIVELSVKNNPKGVPAVPEIPMAVYLIIRTVIACASQITNLTTATTDDQSHTLAEQRLGSLKDLLDDRRKNIKENKYRMLMDLINAHDYDKVLNALTSSTEDGMLLHLSKKTLVNIDQLREQHVLLFISGLDISTETINILKQTYESAQKQNKFEVVWIPVVEQLSKESRAKFEDLKKKMPWYTVHNFSVTDSVVLKYFKQEWHYRGNPIAPVLNKQGVFESRNALDMIRLWGTEAFPFTDTRREELEKIDIMGDIYPQVKTWIQEEKFILFYGGTNTEWSKKLEECAKRWQLLMLHNISHGDSSFWDRVKSIVLSEKAQCGNGIHKLLGYRKEEKWGMLCQGSKVLISCQDDSILELLSHDISKLNDVGYNSYLKIRDSMCRLTINPDCCHYAFPATDDMVPKTLKCKCSRDMEMFITFRCCHKDQGVAAHGPC